MSARNHTRSSAVVYFVLYGDAGPIKIGMTTQNPRQRLHEMQTGAPELLRLLGTIPVGDGLTEQSIHDRFAHLRYRGEWFEPLPELLRYIQTHAEPAGPDDATRSFPPREIAPLRLFEVPPPTVLPRHVERPADAPAAPVPAVADDDAAERRLEDFAIGLARYLYRQPVKRIAADMDLSTRTVKRRAAAALKYDGPMAERLRRLAGRQAAGTG